MATDSNIVNVIAERYALAVYELADEGRILDNIAQDLTKLQSLLDESEDLKILISSPLIDTDKKKLAIEKIM
ncbi:MAG: F0F1 ATP synthase subunit delta, partial [Rhodospirillales bacterium]|nr:F0F1 ATP synthase subunit delta [Rhodospirillales bacterium]